MFTLETARLLIRPWTPDDRPSFLGMARDPEMMRWVHGGTPYTDAEVDEFFARQARQLEQYGVCMGAMVEKPAGRVVGVAGTQPLGTTGELEIGWWVERASWGRGFATEAGQAAMRHALDTLGRTKVLAIIDPGNVPSQKVALRLGMTPAGRCTGSELGHRKPEIVVDLFVRERFPQSAPAAAASGHPSG